MKKSPIFKLLFFYGIFSMFSNVIHPITPTMFTNLNFPDYMFGVAFATMSAAVFLFSPAIGKLGDTFGHGKIFALSLPFYAIAQMGFGLSDNILSTIIARFFAGLFSGASVVCSLAYVINYTSEENRGKYMTFYVAINSACSAFGYFLGGVLGNKSLMQVFLLQFGVLVLAGFAAYYLMEDPEKEYHSFSVTDSLDINPFSSFIKLKGTLTNSTISFLIAVFLTSFATIAYDNAFNYYIKEALNLPSTYNGIIKAVIGIVTLIVNFTINIYIVKKTNIRKSIMVILLLCSITSFLVIFIWGSTTFFIANVIFFMFNAMYLPIQQQLLTDGYDSKTSGIISGVFNSVRSAGMISGSLFAGFIYAWGNKLPFASASAVFLLGALISYKNYRQHLKIKSGE